VFVLLCAFPDDLPNIFSVKTFLKLAFATVYVILN
jgi:hypothetical protein